jgi:hypothetical protein
MATRMQQRRGTATQWTTANPTLAPGEIGFETDTNQFKIGDGVNQWEDLSYFKNLEDLGGSLDDYVPLTTKGQANGVASLNAQGVIPSEQIPSLVGLDTEITTAVNNAVTALVDGAPLALNTLNELAAALGDDANYAQTILGQYDILAGSQQGHTDALNAHGTTSPVVGATDTQTLTNKTISGVNNTITNIPKSAVNALENDLSTITGDITAIEGDITTITGDITTIEGNVTTLQADVTAAEADITSLQDGLLLKAETASPTFTGTVGGITKSMVGLANVDNTSDAAKPVSDATVSALAAKAPLASPTFTGVVALPADTTIGTVSNIEIGYLDGVTSAIQTQLDSKLATANLEEAAQDAVNTALTAGTGITKTYDDVANTLTVAVDTTAIQARVTGVTDTEIGYLDGVSSAIQTQLDAKLSSSNAATTYAPIASPTFTGTVTGVTKAHVGLADVDNTADTAKPVSTAQQTALDLKAPIASPTFTGTVSGINATMVGLGNVNNTADADKPVSTAAQTALDSKLASATAATTYAPIASPTFTGTVAGITKGMVGLGLVDNTADASKPVSTAQASAIATAKSEAIADATSQVNALLTGAPAALNTLDELAAALGDDANFASTVTTSLAAKTPELYTFTPDATATRTLALGDKFASIKFTGATATTITVPTHASVAFPIGTYVEFYQFGAGQLTVAAATPGTTSIRSTDSQKKSRTQYSSMVLIKVDTDEWLLTGDLTA